MYTYIYIICIYIHVYAQIHINVSLPKKCRYLGLFCSAFSRIWTGYGEMWIISPRSVQMRENVDQNNPEYRHFSRSVCIWKIHVHLIDIFFSSCLLQHCNIYYLCHNVYSPMLFMTQSLTCFRSIFFFFDLLLIIF